MLSALCTAQESHDVKILHSYPDGEFDLSIDGKLFTTQDEAQAKQIQKDRARLVELQTENAAQADMIASLKRQVGLEARLADLSGQVSALRQDQAERWRLLSISQSMTIDKLAKIDATMPKKSFLDRLPVKIGFSFLSAGSNARTLFGGPCR